MQPRVIGITGHYQAGKDSVGHVLVAKFGYTRVSLADNVRKMALAINPYIPEGSQLFRLSEVVNTIGWEQAKKDPEIRRLLQVIGTDAVRNILDKDAWIRAIASAVDPCDCDAGRFVITDVRFLNEALWVMERGAVWKVIRPGYDGDGHASETQVDKIHVDATIMNNGTLDDLAESVIRLMETCTDDH